MFWMRTTTLPLSNKDQSENGGATRKKKSSINQRNVVRFSSNELPES
jgi:hypothetical protein